MSRRKLDPRLKEWLDQVIIPALARDFLAGARADIEAIAKVTETVDDGGTREEVLEEVLR